MPEMFLPDVSLHPKRVHSGVTQCVMHTSFVIARQRVCPKSDICNSEQLDASV